MNVTSLIISRAKARTISGTRPVCDKPVYRIRTVKAPSPA